VRDRKIARVEFYPDRRQALDAAGLSGRHRGPIVDSPNLDLVRSIYADWEQGDFSSAEWADPEIEYTRVGELAPAGTWKGLRRMAEGAREVLEAYEDLRIEAEEYSELDGERVFVLDRRSGRGKRSGLQIAGLGAHLFHIRAGKVTRLVDCPDRGRALADLGLEE
jgi:ketosteroid isomerase-like protein